MAPKCFVMVVLINTAVFQNREQEKRSFVQLQVDENSARAAALHSDLELQNSIKLKLCLTCIFGRPWHPNAYPLERWS